MEFVKYFFDLLNSELGGFIVCAFLGISMQDFAYKGFALHNKTTKKEDDFYSEAIGYLVTFAVAIFLYFKINNDIQIFVFNVCLAFGFHILYARFILPWLKNKAKGKS